MKTVKQVSDLTGISVRMIHHYDKIGLLKPSEFTDAGYRLYDEEALKTLQQILFFKELDIPLKEVKEIITSASFDKTQVLERQKKLLILKRDRLNNLVELINKTLEGENTMSFKEFDMSEYYNALEEFKKEHSDRIIKAYGSMDKYNEFIEKVKTKEDEIANMAIKKYGSIEKYVKSMKKMWDSDVFTLEDQYDEFKKGYLEDRNHKLTELYKRLAADLSIDPASKEIQQVAEEITNTAKQDYEIFKTDRGDDYWYYLIKSNSLNPDWIKAVDEKYGTGSGKFIGETLKISLGDKQPKIETLYERFTSDLSKDPSSTEIQEIVKEIAKETKMQNDALKVDEGENHWRYTAELYLSNPTWIKVMDKKYGTGAAKFIGEALKFFSENNR